MASCSGTMVVGAWKTVGAEWLAAAACTGLGGMGLTGISSIVSRGGRSAKTSGCRSGRPTISVAAVACSRKEIAVVHRLLVRKKMLRFH